MDLGLARVQAVASALWGPDFTHHQPLTVIVGGTNGKGTCVTVLSALFTAMGRRVGSFTSPHLFRYNERIRLDGVEVSDAQLCAAFAAIDAARGDTSLTYFEFNALAALWVFREQRVDVQVLEVGLGGRLDAVNLLDADVAVITNVAIDHEEWLGNTREAIGWEKAGILRPGGVLVYGETDMPHSVQQVVAAQKIACQQWQHDFTLVADGQHMEWRGTSTRGAPVVLHLPQPVLPLPSVACALQVMVRLDLYDEAVFARTLPDITLAGRLQREQWQGRPVILDVAHNPAGAAFLASRLPSLGYPHVVALFSAMADKDLAGLMRALAPVVQHWVLFPLADNPRAASLTVLQAAAGAASIPPSAVLACQGLPEALQAAARCQPSLPLLVCGSFFTVAAFHPALDHAAA